MKKEAVRRDNGEGSLMQRKDGTWRAILSIGKKPNGKPNRIEFTGKDKQVVLEKFNKAKAEYRTGNLIEPNKITVGEWADKWLEIYKKPQIRPKTYESYEFLIRTYIKPGLGQYSITNIKSINVQHFFSTLTNLSARTLEYIKTVLHSIFKVAIANGLMNKNVAEGLCLPRKSRKDMRVLTVEEQNMFLETAKRDRLSLIFELAIYTGMRRGELLALK